MKVLATQLMLISFSLQAQIVENAWIKMPMPGLKMTAAYMTITNDTKTELVLEKITGPDALYYEIHTHQKVNGIMKMRQLKKITIPIGKTHILKPMSDHIMIMQTNKELLKKKKSKLTLHFLGNKKKEVSLDVKTGN